MAVDKKNNTPIYVIKSVSDLVQIPDDNIREFAEDAMRLIERIKPVLPLLGVEFDGIRFQPNGLGEIDVSVKPKTQTED